MSWEEPVTELPYSMKSITYDRAAQHLYIGTGLIKGVRPEVWDFNVSGMNVLDKWLGARTQKGIGRAAGKGATPLDRIRPTEWEDEWNDELLDLLRVLTRTVELREHQQELLEEIVASELFNADELPKPSPEQKKVPKTVEREYGQGSFSF
ncbi:type ISP restriction/modification enzyme [Brevibacterium otitidis]|uniref:type ISP restriction/modification enzyme n=1 Tax=Brevibacterium otitidis TaxID=53364 RepID=UPI00360886B8